MYKLFFNNNLHRLQKQMKHFSYSLLVSLLFAIIPGPSNGVAQNLCITNNFDLPDSSAMLDIRSTNKGLLVPRVQLQSTTDIATIHSPAISLLVYNTNVTMIGGGLGFWYWNGLRWISTMGSGLNPGGPGSNVGIGTLTPNSTLQIDGSLAIKHIEPTINLNYTVLPTDCFVDFSKFTTPAICYLPSAVGIEGRIYTIKSINSVALPPAGGGSLPSTINGLTGLFTGIASGSNMTNPATGIVSGNVTGFTLGNISVSDPISATIFTGTFPPATAFIGSVFTPPIPVSTSFNGNVTGNVSSIIPNPLLPGTVTGVFSGIATGTFTDTIYGTGSYICIAFTCPVTGNAPPPLPPPPANSISITAFDNETINGVAGPAGSPSQYPLPGGSNVTLISNGTGWVIGNSSGGATAGTPGPIGPIGPMGPAGADGLIGPAGPTGADGSSSSWGLSGTAGTTDENNFIGTTDNVPFNIRVNNQKAGRIDFLNNTFFGLSSGSSNTSGIANTAIGAAALQSNSTGIFNTAIGFSTIGSNTNGSFNEAIGFSALPNNTEGSNNVAIGSRALFANTTGLANTSVGSFSGQSNTVGYGNTYIGAWANASENGLDHSIAIGSYALVNASGKVRIGDANITVIEGAVSFSTVSDGRFKKNVNENDVKGLEFIMKLRPVSYNVDTKLFEEFVTKNLPDTTKTKHFKNRDFTASTAIKHVGFVAQEVEVAAQESNFEFDGLHKPETTDDNYGLAYGEFVVPLVKAMQEQQKIIKAMQAQIDQLILDVQKNKGPK